MAIKDRVIEIAYKLKDQFTAGTKKITGSLRKVETASDKSTDKMVRNNKRAASSFGGISRAVGPVKLAILGLGAAIAGIIASIGKWTAAAATQERAETKLATSLKNLTGASDDQVQSLKDQAAALQKVTGYTDESIISAQAQLSTFMLTADQIGQLTPRLLDMAESARQAGNESINLEQLAIALGKSFTTGIGSLGEYGVTMSEAQKEAFKLADQQKKVQILTEILDANFIGLAETVGSTYDGAIRKAKASQGSFLETLGDIFTQNKAWIRLVDEVKKSWESLAEGIAGSNKEISTVVSGVARTVIAAAGAIRFTWNALQIVFKSVAVAFTEMASSINYAASLVTFGETSKALYRSAEQMKKYANELRDGIVDDFGDIEDANNSFVEALKGVEDAAEDTDKKIKKLGATIEDAAEDFDQLERSAKNLNGALDDAADEYNKNAKALQQAKKSARELKEEFAELTEEMRSTGDSDINLLDVQSEIAKARRALDLGDEDTATKGARRAAEMLRQMKEEGKEADIVLVGMSKRLERLAGDIAETSTEDELIKADRSKAALDELIAKKQNLVEGPINLDVVANVDAAKQALESIPSEKIITVRYVTVGDVPGVTDGTDYVGRESRKRGTRPQ